MLLIKGTSKIIWFKEHKLVAHNVRIYALLRMKLYM